MANLANAYIFAGRHEDALSLHQKALEFRQGALSANHPDIGAPSPPARTSCADVWWVGRYQHAFDCADVLHDGQATGRSRFEQESCRVLAARAAAQPPDNR